MFLTVLVNFLSQCIRFFYDTAASLGIPSYGLAIIIFTVLIKLVLFPLTYAQLKSTRKMQELQPKIAELQKKFKDNPQKQQQAVMELYKQHGTNPVAGCLPLVVQLPILFALFTALRTFFNPVTNPSLNVANAKFLWIPNLGEADPIILPLLAAVATFLQQWVTMRMSGMSGRNDPTMQTQKTMLYIMPVFMGWICRSFPAGLALYWVVYSIMSIFEQFAVRRQPQGVKGEVSVK